MDNKPTPDEAIQAKIDTIDEPKKEGEEVDVKPDEDSAEEESEETTDEEADSSDKEDDDSGEADGEDDGYTIDDDENSDVEEPPAPKADEVTPVDTSNLGPEQKHILDNLQAVTVRGRVGEGELQEYKVYDPAQLPAGFHYEDQREMSVANKAFSMLETRAERLQQEYRGQSTDKASKEFALREATADRADLGQLQREGDFPKFTKNPSVPRRVDQSNYQNLIKVLADAGDEAGKLAMDVINFKDTQNNKYLDEYNAGRPYKHIGFEEAYHMFQRSNPTNKAQAKEDAERKGIAKRAAKGKGSDNNPTPGRARVHSGMGSRDLDALIEAKTADWS